MSIKELYNYFFNPQWWMCEFYIASVNTAAQGIYGCFPCGNSVNCTKDEALIYAKNELINRHLFEDYGDDLIFLVRRPNFFERLTKD